MRIPLLQVYSPYYLNNYSLVILQNLISCKSVEFTGFTGLKMAGLTIHLVNSGGHQADDMKPNLRCQVQIRSTANSQHPNSLAWGCLSTSEGLPGGFPGH